MATRKSISAKFVFTLLLVLAVGQLVGAVLYLNMTHKQLTGLLEKRMQRTVTQVAQVTAEPIINYNYDIIKSYLTNVMADEDLAQVTLTDMNGKVLAEKRQDEVPSDAIQLQQPIFLANGKDEPLGTVTLKYLPHTTHRTLIEIFFVILFSQGALLAVVAVVLVRLFNSSIKRPVEAINLALSQITGGDLAVSVPVLNKDEIGGIADGVNFLVERLSATIERINRISSSVTMAMGQLQHTFDKVARVVNNQQASTEEVSQALREATEAQQQIIGNTDRLLSISSDNSSALLQMSASSIEIAETTEQLSKNLHNSYSTLTELTQSARQVATMAGEVAVVVDESSASVEEIFRSVKQVEGLVRESASVSGQTSALISEKGMDSIADATESMKGVESFITALTATVDRLDSRSKDIEKILSVIEDVTEKTRLLSFNAQIIAAQAGEYGKGFAVVANQMKELSDRTALSTREIEQIVSSIQNEISEVVSESRETVRVVQDGVDIVGRTGGVLREIMEASEKTSSLSRNIERASLEQTKGLELIVNATEQIKSRISEVTRATAEQEKSTGFLLKNITPIRDAMESARRATEEQASSTRLISSNIEVANQKTSDIAQASSGQQQISESLLNSLDGVVRMGKDTVRDVKEVASFLVTLQDEIEELKREMTMFRTRQSS